jgi:hypothetical protein
VIFPEVVVPVRTANNPVPNETGFGRSWAVAAVLNIPTTTPLVLVPSYNVSTLAPPVPAVLIFHPRNVPDPFLIWVPAVFAEKLAYLAVRKCAAKSLTARDVCGIALVPLLRIRHKQL